MKLLFCVRCGDIRAFEEDLWTPCRCSLCVARWIDAQRGTVEVLSARREDPRIIGLHNGFLMGAARASAVETELSKFHSDLHDVATDAPGYLFDKSRRACWACVLRVGESNDVSWSPHCTKVWSGELAYMEARRAPFVPVLAERG